MNLLDTRTVLISYVVSSLISVGVMATLWAQHRRRSPGLAYWLADFIMQFLGLLLIVLRGNLPDFFSMVLSNTLIIGGTLVLLIGLERYYGKGSRQWYNYVYLAVFFLVQMIFLYIQPSLQWRSINISIGLIVMCGQCAWLLLRRVDPAQRPGARSAVIVFGLFSLVSVVKIYVDLAVPEGNDLFKSGPYDTLVILIYQMLFIGLTFALVLMINRRLNATLESDMFELKRAEKEIEHLASFPRLNPNPVIEVDQHGTVIYQNEAAIEWLEQAGKDAGDLLPPDLPEIWQTFKEGRSGEVFRELVAAGTAWGESITYVPDLDVIRIYANNITGRRRAESLEEAVYRIAAAAETTPSLEELYPQIHQIISSVMPAENFYIALYDEDEDLLRFPYIRDAEDEPFMGTLHPAKGVTAYVLRTGKSLLGTQAVHEDLERRGEVILLGVQSAIWLGVPLIDAGKTIGVMAVQHYTDPQAYGEREQHILEFVSSQVANAIHRKQAEKDLKNSETRYRGLFENSPISLWEEDFSEVKRHLEKLRQQGVIDLRAFFESHPDVLSECANEIKVLDANRATLGLMRASSKEQLIGSLKGVIQLEADTNFVDELVSIAEGKTEYQWEGENCTLNGERITVSLRWSAAPGYENSLEKVLVSEMDITDRKRAEKEQEYISTHDALTGLYNRSFFSVEMERLERGREFPVSVIMADVDELKKTNDQEGHAAGDALLQRVAEVLSAIFRGEDVVARIGGDEFAVLLPGTEAATAEAALQRLQKMIQKNNADHPGRPISLSLGMSTSGQPGSLSTILKEADANMYREKRGQDGSH